MSATSRLLGLDLLRAVAAWLVLLSHVAFWTGAGTEGVVGGLAVRGELGVAIFFALSAFLLSTPFVRRALGRPVSWAPVRYLRRRAARILPGYLVALAAVVAVATWLGGAAASVLDVPTVLVHVVIGQGWTGRTFQSFTQTWSLTTEVTFYLVLPLAAAAAAAPVRGRSPEVAARRLLALCVAVALVGLALQTVAAVPDSRWGGILATSAAGHAAWFALGVAVAVVVEAERADVALTTRPGLEVLRTSPGTLCVLAAVVWLVASTPVAGPRGIEPSSPAEALVAEVLYGLVAGLLLLAGTSRGVTEALGSTPARRVVQWLGDISYGVYLWHVLVLQVAFAVLDLELFVAPFAPTLLLVTVVSVGLAHLSWTLVEGPVLRRVHRSTAAPEPLPAPRG